jgi:hypothetical protein
MSEIALNIDNPESPLGYVVAVYSDPRIMRYWIQVFCDFPQPGPMKRDAYKNAKIPGWKYICEAWDDNPGIRDAWVKASDLLFRDYTYPQVFWDKHIKDTGLLSYINYAPESNKRAYETVLFSEHILKIALIVTNEDAAPAQVESWQYKKVFDFDADEGISGDTLIKIKDKSKIVRPRFDKPIPAAKFKDI